MSPVGQDQAVTGGKSAGWSKSSKKASKNRQQFNDKSKIKGRVYISAILTHHRLWFIHPLHRTIFLIVIIQTEAVVPEPTKLITDVPTFCTPKTINPLPASSRPPTVGTTKTPTKMPTSEASKGTLTQTPITPTSQPTGELTVGKLNESKDEFQDCSAVENRIEEEYRGHDLSNDEIGNLTHLG
jgi:hypothetical protein